MLFTLRVSCLLRTFGSGLPLLCSLLEFGRKVTWSSLMPLTFVCLLIWYSWPRRTIFRPLNSAYPKALCYYTFLSWHNLRTHFHIFPLALVHVLLFPFLTISPGHMLFSVAGKQPKCVATWLNQFWHDRLADQLKTG